jgi:predicted regulator of Ras-like GTPase activity (Roadblock/LC7/MglB family)
MSERLMRSLERLSRVRGVRGSMYVAAEDGLPVAHLLMENVSGKVLAAFAASLARKVSGAAAATGGGRVRFVQMLAEGGVLLVAGVGDELLLAVVADAGVNVGLARLEMLRAVETAAV